MQATPPPLLFGYWRPWNEESGLFESYLDYVKDTSLARYSADIVGKYIAQASKEQVAAIGKLRQQIGLSLSAIESQAALANAQLYQVNSQLHSVNRHLEMQVEQQRVTNLLLKDIGQLLRIPDTEKTRRRHIELGLKFLSSAQKDQDLFSDALEELKLAESLMQQDYFVLHRIGLIYLYSVKHLSPRAALDYFVKAAKYAAVESDPKAVELAIALASSGNEVSQRASGPDAMKGLAACSHEQAAFAAYVLGDFGLAVDYQAKAMDLSPSAEYRFLLAKYHARAHQVSLCLSNLECAIGEQPTIAMAVFSDIDLINEPGVLRLVAEKNAAVDNDIRCLIADYGAADAQVVRRIAVQLQGVLGATYDRKVNALREARAAKARAEGEVALLREKVRKLQMCFREASFPGLKDHEVQRLTRLLEKCVDEPFEQMQSAYTTGSAQYEAHRLKIGARCHGGIVFYIDSSGEHGLVVSDHLEEHAIWGTNGGFGTRTNLGAGKENTRLIVERASWHAERTWFSETRKPIRTAARLCAELNVSGYSDWFLPSKDELALLAAASKRLELYLCYPVSSSESGEDEAWVFSDIRPVAASRAFKQRVWPVRAF